MSLNHKECVMRSHNSGKTWRNENLKKRVVGKQGPDNKSQKLEYNWFRQLIV